MLRFSTALFVVWGLSNSDELGSTHFPIMPYEYLNSSNYNVYQVNNNVLENISIMIMTKVKKNHKGQIPLMAYRAAIRSFRNQRSTYSQSNYTMYRA